MFGMSLPELLVVVVLALVVLGPERLPAAARTVGRFVREARKAANEVRNTLDVEDVRRDLRARNLARQRIEQPPSPDPSPFGRGEEGDPALRSEAPDVPPQGERDRAAVAGGPSEARGDAAALPEIRPAAGVVAVGSLTEPEASGDDALARREAELAAEDARVERELRAYLGLGPGDGPLHLVALPPRGAPRGRLERCRLAPARAVTAQHLRKLSLPARHAAAAP